MKHEFYVTYTPIEDGWILAQAPEIPGAVTQGRTMDEARAMIKEAVELLLESYRENAEQNASNDTVRETLFIETKVS